MDYFSILGQFAHFTRLNLNEKKNQIFQTVFIRNRDNFWIFLWFETGTKNLNMINNSKHNNEYLW